MQVDDIQDIVDHECSRPVKNNNLITTQGEQRTTKADMVLQGIAIVVLAKKQFTKTRI